MILSFSLESKVSNLNYYEKRSLITTIILSLYDTSYKSLIQYCIQGQSTKKKWKERAWKTRAAFLAAWYLIKKLDQAVEVQVRGKGER